MKYPMPRLPATNSDSTRYDQAQPAEQQNRGERQQAARVEQERRQDLEAGEIVSNWP